MNFRRQLSADLCPQLPITIPPLRTNENRELGTLVPAPEFHKRDRAEICCFDRVSRAAMDHAWRSFDSVGTGKAKSLSAEISDPLPESGMTAVSASEAPSIPAKVGASKKKKIHRSQGVHACRVDPGV